MAAAESLPLSLLGQAAAFNSLAPSEEGTVTLGFRSQSGSLAAMGPLRSEGLGADGNVVRGARPRAAETRWQSPALLGPRRTGSPGSWQALKETLSSADPVPPAQPEPPSRRSPRLGSPKPPALQVRVGAAWEASGDGIGA